jgi:sugar O-acyltransferase (sialic acid O-acetyltransferase NeuD family)
MYILGAGTLGEIALETSLKAGIEIHGFFDDFNKSLEFNGVPLLGKFDDFCQDRSAMAKGVFVAIGDNYKRQAYIKNLCDLDVQFPNIIDPSAILSPSMTLGNGNLILPMSYVGTKCSLGSFNLIFPGASITHHNKVGDFCFFSVNSSIGGFATIGDCCKVGMNSVVLPYQNLEAGYESQPSSIIKIDVKTYKL